MNSERQSVTVRGILRPTDLSATNIIQSDRLSDLEVRINGKGVVGDSIRRTAETDAQGRFTFDPLPPGDYRVMPTEVNYNVDRSANWTRRELPGVFTATKLMLSLPYWLASDMVRFCPAALAAPGAISQ